MADEPPSISPRYCPGGSAVFVNTDLHIAQCPGGCDIWFDTMMDEPTFPPHIITTVVTFGSAPFTCDYHHDTEPDVRPATWGLIGEAGDFYVCDEHYAMRTEEGCRGWHRVG